VLFQGFHHKKTDQKHENEPCDKKSPNIDDPGFDRHGIILEKKSHRIDIPGDAVAIYYG
jgi:hypothetical protein